MLKHICALLGISVIVFGTIFLLTNDWPFNAPMEEGTISGEGIMPAAENVPSTAEAQPQPAPAEQAQPEEAPAGQEGQQTAAAQEAPTEQGAAAEQEAPAQTAPAATELQTAPAQTTQTAQVDQPAQTQPAAAPAQGGDVDVAALVAEGEEPYGQLCAACHGPEGEGAIGPALEGNADLEDAEFVIDTILHGREMMPPFRDQLDDAQVAAVSTMIRNSWGNEFGPVTVEDVAAVDAAGGGQGAQ